MAEQEQPSGASGRQVWAWRLIDAGEKGVSFPPRPLLVEELVASIGRAREFTRDQGPRMALPPLRQAWLWRVYRYLFVASEPPSLPAEPEQAIREALEGLGRGVCVDWLVDWLVLYFHFASKEPLVPGEEPPDPIPLESMEDLLASTPSPPEGLLIRPLPGELLLDTIRRGQTQLRDAERLLGRQRLVRRPGPRVREVRRAIEWTWRYYVEQKQPTEIAAEWNEEQADESAEGVALPTDVTDSLVATTISRTAGRLGLPYP